MNEQLDNPDIRKSAQNPLSTKEVTGVPKSRYGSQPPRVPRKPQPKEEEEDESFLKRNRPALIVVTVVVLIAAWLIFRKPSASSEPAHKAPEMMVRIQLPPPPPPPPPKAVPPPPKQERQPELAPVDKPVDKPIEKPKPVEKPPEGLGTSIRGSGPGMGLGYGSGNGIIGGTGTGPGGGSQFGWYAGQVQAKIVEALRNNRKTRSANLRVEVRVWPDATGRITRAELKTSSGDSGIDDAIKNEVLSGLQLQEPPPAGMPTPIVLRLIARRPN